jgi:hypothetical protein
MMSPTVKKILLVGGAAVVGYVVYKKVTAAKAKAETKAVLNTVLPMQFQVMKAGSAKMADSEELGVSEDLGSLGGGFR